MPQYPWHNVGKVLFFPGIILPISPSVTKNNLQSIVCSLKGLSYIRIVKLLLAEAFSRLKIQQNSFLAGALFRNPLPELMTLRRPDFLVG